MGILGVTFSKKEDEKYINVLNDLQQTQNELNEYKEKFSAIDKVQAIIEFRPDGTIVSANDNFLKTMGYELNEIKDRHHKMFVDPAYAESSDYKRFWERLRTGENLSDEFSRISKDGSLRWLQAAYTPITDQNGNIYKIVKFATDITKQKIMNSDFQGQIEAINRSYAVIEFNMDGTILTANKLFLDAMGYDLDEVKGRHHSIFVDNNYKHSDEYKRFWQELKDGKFSSNEYKRFRKDGEEIWILASYNPVFDQQGKPYKVVKFATDVTEQKLKNADFEGQLTAIRKSQAVIEFDMQGNILEANDLFLEVMGYSLDEIKGKHHSIFVEQEYSRSAEYHDFWKKLNDGEFFSNEFKRIGKGGKIVWIQASYNPILDLNGKPFKVVKFASDVSQQKNHEEVARIKHALDYVSASVMIADHNNNIIYLNQAVEKMLQHAEADIRKDLSNFTASQLMGKSMDFYHKNPDHQKRLISSLTSTHTSEISLGGRIFRLVVNPVFNEDGRLGSVVEWYDRTTEVAIEKEIDNVVDAASKGDFNQQIDTERKHGFFKSFSEKLNELCGTSKIVLADIQHAFDSLAKGDLTKRITNDYDGSYQRLKENLNSTTDKITEVISEILNSSLTIEGASNEITQGNLDLSQRTEEQASSLEETASSMEEMTTSVKQCSSMASEANTKSGEAVELANTGGAIVQESIGAMGEISKASKKIAEIISVIDDIAFQTNLLALNAAVEAARAGDQGKGFAVVAGEVRKLSQRSAGAAKEIKELIQDSLNKVENGTVLAKKSGETLSSIIGSISNVSSAMEELKKATYEQSIGIEQVNKAISQMDEMTQQNAALVEESSAASKSLLDSAKKLNETVGFFKIKLEQPAEKKFHSNHYERTAPIRRKPSPAIHANQEQGDLEWEDF